jgi:hypothetical protein
MASTPYMGLDLPVPTVTIGPAYASMIVTAFESIDEHDHTTGKGAQIPTAGLNINADLSFAGFSASSLKSLRFSDLSVALSDPSDLNCLYNVNGNLYYNDGAGNQIQITAGGGLNASSVGGIGGDYATSSASLFYTDATKTFTFWQAANTPALIDCGDITIRETVASAEGITIKSPTSLAASYTLTLPGALPASTKILSVSAAGVISSVYDVDNSTIEVSSDTLRLKDSGITTAKIQDGAVTPPKLAAFNSQITASLSPSFSTSTTAVDITGATVTITTQGRAVVVGFQSDGVATNCGVTATGLSPSLTAQGFFLLLRDTGSGYSTIASWEVQQTVTTTGTFSITLPPSAIEYVDLTAPAGSVSYKMQYYVGGANMRVSVTAVKFLAYEKV